MDGIQPDQPFHPRLRLGCRLAALGAAFLFSTGGAAIKATTLTSWQVASFRSGIAAGILFLLVPAARQNWSWRVPLAGVAYAITLITFVSATKMTTSANAIFLQSTGPFYLLLLGPWLLKEPIRFRDLRVMLLMVIGMILVLFAGQPSSSTAPDPVQGNLVGILTGIAWAFTLASLRWLGRHRHDSSDGAAMAAVVAGNLIAFLGTLPMAFPVAQIAARDFLVLAYLGVIQIGLAYFLLTLAVRHLSAMETSLLILAEPALNPLWTWLIHREKPAQGAIVGGMLILLATLTNLFRPAVSPRG